MFHNTAPQAQVAWGFKYWQSLEEYRSMWSPRPLVVSTVKSPIVPTETAQCSVGPVALSICIVQILCAVTVGVQRMVE